MKKNYNKNQYTARLLFTRKQRRRLFIIFILSVYCFILFPKASLITIIIISNFFFLSSFIVKAVLFIIGIFIRSRNQEKQILDCDIKNLPIYSLLIPLYKEAKVVKYLISSLKKIEYPTEKLDIKLIVEEDDKETFVALNNLNLTSQFEIIKVPYSLPRTKAKACNYALPYVKGKYLGIYDAEDIPAPTQLKEIVNKFSNTPSEIICIQAKLNYFNRNENFLTKLFSLEYLIWFEFILPALEYLDLPIPLGGTSNHFITDKLKEIGGWDPYNVTEDAELGIRIVRLKHKACIIDSLTLEEAPINIKTWFNQRARWIKGYIQTYIVHMRNPFSLYKSLGIGSYLGVQFFIGVFTVSFILTPFAIISWIIFIFGNANYFLMPTIAVCLWKINLVVSLLNMLKFKIASNFTDIKNSNFVIMLFPLYFLMISISSFKSLWQLAFNPYYWDKTAHGLTKYKRNL